MIYTIEISDYDREHRDFEGICYIVYESRGSQDCNRSYMLIL